MKIKKQLILFFAGAYFAFSGSVPLQSAEMGATNNNRDLFDSCVVVDLLSRFNPAFPKQWGLGGAQITFDSIGTYFAPYISAAKDRDRHDVGLIHFPTTKSTGQRELNFLVGAQNEATGISFYAKWLGGSRRVILSIYSESKKRHYQRTVDLLAEWKRLTFDFTSLICQESPVDKIDPGAISTLQFMANSEEARFLIDDLVLVAQTKNLNRGMHILRPRGAPWCFVHPAKKIDLSYFISSIAHDTIVLKVAVKNRTGWQNDSTLRLSVAKGENLKTIPVLAHGFGYYSVTLTITDTSGSQILQTLDDYFIVRPKPHPAKSPIGVNLSPLAYSRGHLQSLANGSIDIVRVWDYQWPDIEPFPGNRNFISLDTLTDWASSARIDLLATTGYAPSWKIKGPSDSPPPWRALDLAARPSNDLDGWGSRFSLIASRYKSSIRFWEFWNEPDWTKGPGYGFWGKKELYFDLLKTTQDALAISAPNAMIISGGISKNPRHTDPQFVQSLLNRKLISSIGAFGFHAYHDRTTSKRLLDSVRSHRPKIPLWMTEIGALYQDDEESSLRNFLSQLADYTFDFLAAGTSYWSIMYVHPYLRPGFKDYALLNANGSPMSRLAAICTMAYVLCGVESIKRLSIDSPGMEIYEFKSILGFCLAVRGQGSLVISSKSAIIKKVDALGEEQDITLVKGQATVKTGNDGLLYILSDKPITLL